MNLLLKLERGMLTGCSACLFMQIIKPIKVCKDSNGANGNGIWNRSLTTTIAINATRNNGTGNDTYKRDLWTINDNNNFYQ